MLKYILPIFLSFFIIACSNDANNNSDAKTLSITRAISSTTPISIFHTLSLEFSSKLDSASVNDTNIILKDSAGASVEIAVELISPANTKVVITPFTYFNSSSSYTLVVTTGIKNEAGESLSKDSEFSFTTLSDSSNPGSLINVVDLNPEFGGIANIDTNILIEFDRYIAPSKTNMLSVKVAGNEVSGTYEYLNSSVKFTPNSPFASGSDVNVTILNPPTDMYGNDTNLTSGSSWSFSVDANLTSGVYLKNLSINIAHKGYLVRSVKDSAGSNDYIAVAREGGIEFYNLVAGNTDAPTITKLNSEVLINSEITDMVFYDGASTPTLLVATLKDGMYKIDTSDLTSLVVTRLLTSTLDIYGVANSEDGNGKTNRVYAVGPNMGMKVFSVDINNIFTLMKEVAIAGKPLKVIGHPYGPSGKTYVVDYETGLLVFDENGTSPSTINTLGSSKFITYITDNSQINSLQVVSSIGGIQNTSADTPSSLSSTGYMLSRVSDVTHNALNMYISMPDKGFYILDYSGAHSYIKTTGRVISGYYDFFIVTLDEDGTLSVFYQGA